jgi:hypothetical protein
MKLQWNGLVPTQANGIDGQGGDFFGPERPYWFLNVIHVVDKLLSVHADIGTHFVANLGSTGGDAVIDFLRHRSWPGAMFDLVSEGVPDVSPLVRKVTLALNPVNVAAAFAAQNVPLDLTLLKIDIDGYDCDVMEALFAAGYSPAILIMELNAAWPPPLRFKISYMPEYVRQPRLYGCSLQYASEFLEARGYVLLQYPMEDGWFVKTPLAHHFGDIPHNAVACYDAGNPGAQWGGFGIALQQRWLELGRDRKNRPALLAEVHAEVQRQINEYPTDHFMRNQPFTLGVSLE